MLLIKLSCEHNNKQEIVFKKDKATLQRISKKCEDSKLFQINLKKIRLHFNI